MNTYEAWVAHVFDHPVTKPEWHWQTDAHYMPLSSAETVGFLTRLFAKPDAVLSSYSDSQVNQGLWYILQTGLSDYSCAIFDRSVDLRSRMDCIASIYSLFERLFARRCTKHLSHIDQPGAGSLNQVCYMFWDIMPSGGGGRGGEPGEVREILSVMEKTLELDSLACHESALHGLGHYHFEDAARVESIIDAYLGRGSWIAERLRSYALKARSGDVL